MLTEAGHRALLGCLVVLGLAAGLVALVGGSGPDDTHVVAALAPTTTAPARPSADVPEGDGSGPTPSVTPTTGNGPPTTVPTDASAPVGAVGAFTPASGDGAVAGA